MLVHRLPLAALVLRELGPLVLVDYFFALELHRDLALAAKGQMPQVALEPSKEAHERDGSLRSLPTALDNRIRSSRNLLRAFKVRLLGGKQRAAGIGGGEVNERLAVVAALLPGSRERAAQILAKGAPYGLALAGFRRHSVYLAEETLVFVFEGPGIERLLRDLVNDPARSAAFGVWAPLLQGTPVLAREDFYWDARQ